MLPCLLAKCTKHRTLVTAETKRKRGNDEKNARKSADSVKGEGRWRELKKKKKIKKEA